MLPLSSRNQRIQHLLSVCSENPTEAAGESERQRMHGKLTSLLKSEDPHTLLLGMIDYLSDTANIAYLSKSERVELTGIAEGLAGFSPALEPATVMKAATCFPDLLPALFKAGADPRHVADNGGDMECHTAFGFALACCSDINDARGSRWTIDFYCSLIDLGAYPNDKVDAYHSDLVYAAILTEQEPLLGDVVVYALQKSAHEANSLLFACLHFPVSGYIESLMIHILSQHETDIYYVEPFGNPDNLSIYELAQKNPPPDIMALFDARKVELDSQDLNTNTQTVSLGRARRL